MNVAAANKGSILVLLLPSRSPSMDNHPPIDSKHLSYKSLFEVLPVGGRLSIPSSFDRHLAIRR